MLSREAIKASIAGVVATLGMIVLVFVGSRNLSHFDAALFGYLFATLFAVFAIVYRYSMWLQRPPTAMYWKRGWQVFFKRGFLLGNVRRLGQRFVARFLVNDFIFKRSWKRGIAHWLIMWGCLIAAAITFPLVFGWIHFDTLPDNYEYYRIYIFGFPTFAFKIHSLLGHLIFHGLVWASFLVIPGVMLAFHRRMREHGAAAVQRFGEDILPLLMLFAISVTGLLLWISYSWMHGYGYDFLAIIHALTVILTLLWLPFGKFFHIFQRPAQLGVSFYKDVGTAAEQAHCARCNEPYASRMHVEDLITVERQLGYKYDMPNESGKPDHYQRVCPRCRRAMFAIAQGRLWASEIQDPSATEELSEHG